MSATIAGAAAQAPTTTTTTTVVRVLLPQHLRTLSGAGRAVDLPVAGTVPRRVG
jgi:hypothetical protein